MVDVKLRSKQHQSKSVVHYTSGDWRAQSNAAYLAGSFAVMFLGLRPDEVYSALTRHGVSFAPFIDASLPQVTGESYRKLQLLDCFRAIDKAIHFKFFDFKDFDDKHYSSFEVDGYPELSWIVPEKLVAMANPVDDRASPIDIPSLVRYFLNHDVRTLVRLNIPTYRSSRFSNQGIRHFDLYFDDGTTPPSSILKKFLMIVEGSPSATAVHCKAGLGRTGCLIGAYLVKHYRLTSKEAVAWMRICRPAMVIGAQQDWLASVQSALWRMGDQYRNEKFSTKHAFPFHTKGIYSQSQRRTSIISSKNLLIDERRSSNLQEFAKEKEPLSQGDYLLAVKKMHHTLERKPATR